MTAALQVPMSPGQNRPGDAFYGTLAIRPCWVANMLSNAGPFVVYAFGATAAEAVATCRAAAAVLHPGNRYRFAPLGAPFRPAMLDSHEMAYLVMPALGDQPPIAHEYHHGALAVDD